MLSIFPDLFFLAPLSAFLIRIALGIVLGYAAISHFEQKTLAARSFAVMEGATALEVSRRLDYVAALHDRGSG